MGDTEKEKSTKEETSKIVDHRISDAVHRPRHKTLDKINQSHQNALCCKNLKIP